MCGICILLRQCLRTAPSHGPKKVAPDPHLCSLPNGQAATVKPTEEATAVANALGVPPTSETYDFHPCCSSQPGFALHRCMSGAEEQPPLLSAMIQNLRRRGPNTFGVTRRSFHNSYHPHHQCPSPLQGCSGASDTGSRNNSSPHLDEDRSRSGSSMAVVEVETAVMGIASVLGLRGHFTVPQPYDMNVETDTEEDGHVWEDCRSSLMWNGEIFGGALCPPPWGSDTVLLASRLSQMEVECAGLTEQRSGSPLPLQQRQFHFLRRCTSLLEQQVEGPYSFAFIATRLQLTVFGRDPLGRHSLLTHVALKPSAVVAGSFDVELIVSSVGVQHRRDGEDVADEGEAADDPASGAATAKRARVETGDGEDAEGDDEEEMQVCWEEVPVSGLFAIPLQIPLLCVTQGTEAPPRMTVETRDAESALLQAKQAVTPMPVRLLHCPWRRRTHLLHPLFRTVGLPMVPQEPMDFRFVLSTDEVAALPPFLTDLARSLMKTDHPDELEQSWVDWAAGHYLLALGVSMHRRITVANSGAADGRDAEMVSSARRRPLCILFSGGIDCTVLATLAHYLLPVETPIELVNVAFGAELDQAPDRIAAFRSMEELLRLPLPNKREKEEGARDNGGRPRSEREWRLVLVDIPEKSSSDTSHIKDLLAPRHTVMDLDIGTALWYAARATGRMQMLYRSDIEEATASAVAVTKRSPAAPQSPTTTTIAASEASGHGGLSLDGFSKHFRIHDRLSKPLSSLPVAPALVGGEVPNAEALPQEGQLHDADKEAKFSILVDILVKEGRSGGGARTAVLLSTLGKEYRLFLEPHLQQYGYKKLGSFLNDAAKAGFLQFAPDAPSKAVRLCRPHDMRRAATQPRCRWFMTRHMKERESMATSAAADEEGKREEAEEDEEDSHPLPLAPAPGTFQECYTSTAKVLILGMGADETLGGYTRYRRFYSREGMPGARRELEKDFARLWQRNLGRDDRITMDSGREPRFPFLDEGVLRTLEWLVQKRRNSVLTAQEWLISQSVAASPTSSEGPATAEHSPTASNPHPTLSANELLRLALDPIVSFQLSAGKGDKRVLRRVAAALGLGDVTHLQKRAIQFGSRIAERRVRGTTDF